MPYYINPPTLTKEAWLKENGKLIADAPAWNDVPQDSLPVCLTDTSMFTTAYIIYDESELELVKLARKKQWYLVLKEKIIQVEPSIAHLVKLPKRKDDA